MEGARDERGVKERNRIRGAAVGHCTGKWLRRTRNDFSPTILAGTEFVGYADGSLRFR